MTNEADGTDRLLATFSPTLRAGFDPAPFESVGSNDVRHYLSEMALELAGLADQSGLTSTAVLLRYAAAEAVTMRQKP